MKKGVSFGVGVSHQLLGAGHALSLPDLDDGSLALVLRRVDVRTLCAVAQCCRSLAASLGRLDCVWRSALIHMLPYTPRCLPLEPSSGCTWKSIAKNYCVAYGGASGQIARAAVQDTMEWVHGGAEGPLAGVAMNLSAPGWPRYYRTAIAQRLGRVYAHRDISVNNLLAWNSSARVRAGFHIGSHGGAAHGSSLGCVLVRSVFPFSEPGTSLVGMQAVRYIEARVLELQHDALVSFGVMADRQAFCNLRGTQHVGHGASRPGTKSSIGLFSNTGKVFPGEAEGGGWRGVQLARAWEEDDVVGCGMSIVDNSVFYTLNGEVVGVIRGHGRPRQGGSGEGAVEALGQPSFLDALMASRRRSQNVGLADAVPCFQAGAKRHVVPGVDVAHSVFAVSLQGVCRLELNLGQGPFVYDIGNDLELRDTLEPEHSCDGASVATSLYSNWRRMNAPTCESASVRVSTHPSATTSDAGSLSGGIQNVAGAALSDEWDARVSRGSLLTGRWESFIRNAGSLLEEQRQNTLSWLGLKE